MTRPNAPRRLLPSRHHRARVGQALIADIAERLTPRDAEILDAVWEHRVLTTDQLAAIFFPSVHRARHRLLDLYELRALDRFRPWAPTGSRPWHWILGTTGAHHLAAQRGITPAELRYRPDSAGAIAFSSRLTHQVGVNEFFAQLHATAHRRADGSEVAEWWPERRCAALWGDLARPDAFGRWSESSPTGKPDTIDFFLEHDTGTEPLSRVLAKLDGYAALAEATGITTPVLFWLPNPTREANFRKLLTASSVPVATAVHTPATAPDGPAGPVWLPTGSAGPRRRLIGLRSAWGQVDAADPNCVIA
ncbi:replication-relaxation family protein [Actinomadura sp. ATCC 31491]|uniref:Replication-relaxation family protein n=1 Tax=Actinomadura luzonensis TaxID=2805427 RepID=A0ABT0FNU8_9ACTN|nr:replication-relaxation family protein [Actinomadura luzonensis]MCK2214028.1 replication-relaxation family protein [Actinomadura luzonensis]